MNQIPKSLRARYWFYAVVLGLVMLGTTLWAYRNLAGIQAETASNLEIRSQLAERTRTIRVLLLDSYKSLDVFLLEPNLKQYRQQVSLKLGAAVEEATLLRKRLSSLDFAENGPDEHLIENLQRFRKEAKILFDTRMDTNRQYPSLAVGNTTLQPNRDRMNNAISLAVQEASSENKNKTDPEVYKELILVRHIWGQLISNNRMYLANRVGSFDEKALPVQERGIETLMGELQQRVQELKTYDQQGRLGFEASAAVDDMLEALRNWFAGWQKVRVIHNSGEWRIDSKIMREVIAPLVGEISGNLEAIENRISKAATQDIQLVSQAADQQTHVFWVTSAIGVFFILMLLVTMDALLLRPIEAMVRALKAEAFGKGVVDLPSVDSRETRDLVDAFSEMRNQVHQRQFELEHQATHDALTTLPNRVLLHDRIEHNIRLSRRAEQMFALMVIDLDRFKEVNDTLGHQVGDELLIEVGKRFQTKLREIDTVARLGGDEFAVLLPECTEEDAEHVANKLVTALEPVIQIGEMQLFINASIGIAFYPVHGLDTQTLLKHADVAMYVAKQNQNRYSLYDPERDDYSIRQLALISDLRIALEQNDLQLYYQPKIGMHDGKVLGVEALLRWRHPEFGMIPPPQMIDIAERTGLIRPLTYWVIEQAACQCQVWREAGHAFHVSVNLSVHTLRDTELVDRVHALITKCSLPPSSLFLEITEGAMMDNPLLAIDALSRLDRMGVNIAVDDFGTGFSSLAYLKQLPVDELKIDKSFIMDMLEDQDDLVIVRSIIDLAHNLGLQVVAEGVETSETNARLRTMGCDVAQGYFFSKPLPADELEKWIVNEAPGIQGQEV